MTGEPTPSLEEIADALARLRADARRHKAGMLAYMLAMAEDEAREEARRQVSPGRPRRSSPPVPR